MRDLVDVQRKIERRHRRDRERQMLRVRGENLTFWCQQPPSHSTAALAGSGAPGHRTEQEGRGKSAGSAVHRQADAPDTKAARGKARHMDTGGGRWLALSLCFRRTSTNSKQPSGSVWSS